jgi:hypothetical protein
MRIAEKTLELTLCCQLGGLLQGRHWWHPSPYFGPPQPLWFGLTQAQEAKAGFDAAMRLGNHRILLLQFKAGVQLAKGQIRFSAQHHQLIALQQRVRMHRLVYYVLPEVTRTSQLHGGPWLLASTWLLDVASIPTLSPPTRRSQNHHIYLTPGSRAATIHSDPVNVELLNASDLQYEPSSRVGAQFENFEKFWSYANLLGKNSVATALPGRI